MEDPAEGAMSESGGDEVQRVPLLRPLLRTRPAHFCVSLVFLFVSRYHRRRCTQAVHRLVRLVRVCIRVLILSGVIFLVEREKCGVEIVQNRVLRALAQFARD